MSNTVDPSGSEPAAKPSPKFLGLDITPDWLLRPLFGIGLAVIAVAATYYGGFWFALFMAVSASAAAREWHRMLAGSNYGWLTIVSALALIGATFSEVFVAHTADPELLGVPWLILAAGALLCLVLSPVRRNAMLWHAGAMLYVGVPSVSLVAIREVPSGGMWELLVLFFAIWFTDTGALFTGKMLRGPKLWPAMSPNKTWAGSVGGAFFGALAAAVIFLILRANPWHGAVLGFCASIIGQAGDLFESFVKRRAGRKNSGSLIPGHGGVLDRIDSMLFVAPVAALVFVALHIDPFALGAP